MCLIKNKNYHPHNRPLKTEEDIICYKLLQVKSRNTYLTPILSVEVPIECIKGEVPFVAQPINKTDFSLHHLLGTSGKVESGFIHTYKSKWKTNSRYSFFKCVIPKGTRYFIGQDDDYASEQIIFAERLK